MAEHLALPPPGTAVRRSKQKRGRMIKHRAPAAILVITASVTSLSGADPSSFGTTKRVSLAPASGLPGDSSYGSVTSDGRWVAFDSMSVLAVEDVNDDRDVYLRDMSTGEMRLISSGSAGSSSLDPSISADGSLIAYVTRGQDAGLYVYDIPAQATRLAVSGDGIESGLSSNGRWAFIQKGLKITVVDLASGAITTVLGASAGSISDSGTLAFIDQWGRLTEDIDGVWDVYLLDLLSGGFINLTDDLNLYALNTAISADGRTVALEIGPEAVEGVIGIHAVELYVEDLRTGERTFVSNAVEPYDRPSIDATGSVVAYASPGVLAGWTTNAPRGDPVAVQGIYVWERASASTTLVSVRSFAVPGVPGPHPGPQAANPQISDDGRFVVFDSSQWLDGPDADLAIDVYLHDRIAPL